LAGWARFYPRYYSTNSGCLLLERALGRLCQVIRVCIKVRVVGFLRGGRLCLFGRLDFDPLPLK